MRVLDPNAPRHILVRGTNWVGDAVMSLPALAALGRACSKARIDILAKPWAGAVYEAAPSVARVITFDSQGGHKGIRGLLSLAGELKGNHDWAILMQNALQAAVITWLARTPVRLGYATDGRSLLLTHSVPLPTNKSTIHETSYYLGILKGAGLIKEEPPSKGVQPELELSPEQRNWSREFLEGQDCHKRILGLAPGAAYGPAKCWPASRFADAARALVREGFASVLIMGGRAEREKCEQVARELAGLKVINLAGRTDLRQAISLLERLALFITNDSGLMHAAAALAVPTVAVFGSTNPVTTGPLGPWVKVVRRVVDCSPCLKAVCPLDLRCFTAISAEEVAHAGLSLWRAKAAAIRNG